MSNRFITLVCISTIMLLIPAIIKSNQEKPYRFLSPTPNSSFNSIESTIIIRDGALIDQSSIIDGIILVRGSKSGEVSGEVILSSDQKTIIFKPNNPFLDDETVEINITGGIKTIDGKTLPAYSCIFKTEPLNFKKTFSQYNYESDLSAKAGTRSVDSKTKKINFPQITTNILNEPAIGEGKIFLAAYGVINQTFQSDPSVSSSILVVNKDGSLFYSKDIGSNQGAGLTDFKMHSNGLMSYPEVISNYLWTGGAEVSHTIMDESFTEIDSYQMGNGYTAELHDFQMLPNGHVLMMAYYLVPIDLTGIVPNAHPNAMIDGAVVQELDKDKNVIFQWRTWDYLNPGIIPWNMVPGNTQQIINVFHANSLRLDNDGNILLGTVGMGIKISRQSGQIIWIIGGIMNQFTFTNVGTQEAVGDFGGHTFHRLENGNILVYDNSPFPWQPGFGQISSEVVEYSIDEENKTAELVWKYQPEQIISGWHAGSAQRLSNGNTVIGWGGPPNEGDVQIPIMTEVTQSGEKVFELFYEGNDLESYRAFRFALDDGLPNSQITVAEIAPGNVYPFTDENQPDPGIELRVNNVTGVGYNEVTVSNYNFAPSSPEFPGKSPIVIPRRMVLSQFGTTSINAYIRFDVNNWGVADPDNTVIYYREFENTGLFIPLATTYNFVTGKLQAEIAGYGEFILGKPDLDSQLNAPKPNSPENEVTHNYQLPLQLSWSPVGYVNTYSLQVSLDENFTTTLVDETLLTEATYNLTDLLPATQYFWRVNAQNDAGESDWCAVQTFTTVDPFILVTQPNGGERWHIGLEYYIEWDDNIDGNVVISLLKDDTEVKQILTSPSTGAYLWEVDLDLTPADDYKIQITSIDDETLFDISDDVFSIIDTVSSVYDEDNIPTEYTLNQNYPNPFNPATTISYSLPTAGRTIIKVYDLLGNEITTLVDTEKPAGYHEVVFNASNLTSGIYFYSLTSGKFSTTNKMIFLK